LKDLVETGSNIVLLRNEQGLTQEELAFRSNMSVSRLQDIEHGCLNMIGDTLVRIAEALGIDSQIIGIFLWPEKAISSEVRQTPRLPERQGELFQGCKNIVLLRKAEGLTQIQLARLSHMSPACLRDIEHGCANMTVKKLLSIANSFGMSLTRLDFCAMSEDELIEIVRNAKRMAGRMG